MLQRDWSSSGLINLLQYAPTRENTVCAVYWQRVAVDGSQ